MAASVVEVITATTTSTAHVVPITTALVPGDLVVCISSTYNATSSHITPSGLGTWSGELSGLSGAALDAGIRVHTLTGVTGAGNITLSQTAAGSRFVILVISGLDLPVLADKHAYWIPSASQTAAVVTARARDNAVAVTVSHFMGGTPGNPASADPATGWVSDWNTAGASSSNISVSHNVIAAGQIVEATLTGDASSFDRAVGLFIFGTPLETRLQAESVEVMHDGTGTQPGRALRGEYVEALTGGASAPDRAVHGETAEVLWTDGVGTRKIAAETAEVLHGIPAGAQADRRILGDAVEVLTQALPGAKVGAEYVEVLHAAVPPAADSAVYSETVEVLGYMTPPIAPAAVHAEHLEVLMAAAVAELPSVTIEVLRRYVPPGSTPRFRGWGIPL